MTEPARTKGYQMTRHYRNTRISGMGTGAVTNEQSRAQTVHQIGVLVVDDNESVRMLLESGLKHYGFRVWLASDGWDAIEVYRDHGTIAVSVHRGFAPCFPGPFDPLPRVVATGERVP